MFIHYILPVAKLGDGQCWSTVCVVSGKGGGGKDKVTLAKLQSQLTQQDKRKVTTLSVQDLLPSDKAKVETKMTSQLERPL